LNNTQHRVKQLESRLQMTEVSNRALLEEVIRLQNDLALSLRKSFDTLQEERTARQALENNYKFQTDNVLQLNGRLKRAEDLLQENRSAMQSLIVYTKTLEQSAASAQKDLFVRREFQSQRLDELRQQIDDLKHSKEGLERSAYTLLEEIKALKNKVDMEAINLSSISGDLRNKTRLLEEENRQYVRV
jgi:chromosome segregation ATPase